MESPTVATYPSVRGRSETQGCVFQQRKTCGIRHQHLFEENVRKTKKGSANLKKKKGFKSCLRAGKVLAPTRPSQRMAAFNRVCKIMTLIFIYCFLFYVFYLLGSTRAWPLLLRILKCDEELRPTQFFKSKKSCASSFF